MEEEKSMTIVLCSKGYPGKYKKNIKLNKIKSLNYQKMITFFMQELKF